MYFSSNLSKYHYQKINTLPTVAIKIKKIKIIKKAKMEKGKNKISGNIM